MKTTWPHIWDHLIETHPFVHAVQVLNVKLCTHVKPLFFSLKLLISVCQSVAGRDSAPVHGCLVGRASTISATTRSPTDAHVRLEVSLSQEILQPATADSLEVPG